VAAVTHSSSPAATGAPTGSQSSLSAWWRHVAALTYRNLVHVRREPAQLSDATVQPVLFTVLFVYIFGAAMVIPGGTYKQFAIAGLVVFNITTSTMGTAVGVSSDLKSGVIDRFRTLPMARSTILAGRTFSDLLASILCATIVLITGFVIGWRPDNGLLGVLAGLGIAVLFAYAMSWMMACVGLSVSDPESAQGIGLLVLFPIAFVSSAMVPTQGLPGWMQPIAEWNPVSAVAGALRELFGNPNPAALRDNFPSQNPVLMALIWSAVILAISIPIARARLKARTVD
jgi:ABC transporter DrrB family efflux protein